MPADREREECAAENCHGRGDEGVFPKRKETVKRKTIFLAEAQRTQRRAMTENDITGIIVDCSVKIHKTLGPGLFESVYEEVLAHELKKKVLNIERQVGIPVEYDGLKMDLGFRADILVENLVLVELKSVETVLPIHKKQLLTYLKLSGKKVGLLINFNEDLIKNGITRIANGI